MKRYNYKSKNTQTSNDKEVASKIQLIPYENDEVIYNPLEEEEEEYEDDWNMTDDQIKQRINDKNLKLEEKMEKYANPFPADVFPKEIYEYVIDLERCTNAPIEYTSVGILTAIAGAIGNKFHTEIKAGLSTSPILYAVIIGETGTNKSNPLRTALKPLLLMDREYSLKYEKNMALNSKTKAAEKENYVEPIPERCLVNDITMEALVDILENNAVTVYHDEFNGFLNSMNKYRAGDDMEKWLSLWNGVFNSSDRKGKKGKRIAYPFVNCIGTIQPDVLAEYMATKNTNNGFIERLLYVQPCKELNNYWNDAVLDLNLEERYHEIVKCILNIPKKYTEDGEEKPMLINFASRAFESIKNWQNKQTLQCSKNPNKKLVGIYKKLEIYCIRFSLIMAVMDYAYKAPALLIGKNGFKILDKHVQAAIKITEYFKNTAKSVLTLIPNIVNTKNYDKRFYSMYKLLPRQFKTMRALEIGAQVELSERAVHGYLKTHFFIKLKHGFHEKAYREI